MKTVIVGGVIANKLNNGGAVWTRLNWILGLKKLGFHVYFVEQIEQLNCVDEDGVKCDFEQSANLAYFRRIIEDFGLAQSAVLVCDEGRQSHGMSMTDLNSLVRNADLLVNITGHLHLPAIMKSSICKIYIDLDPGYTQYWHQMGALDSQFEDHDHYFTIGEAIGTPACPIPTSGIPWRTTRQPVVLEYWPVSHAGERNRFTTIASWRDNYGTLEWDGIQLGLKVHEFRKFIKLPQRVPQVCELALDIHPADQQDLDMLHKNDWVVRDPHSVASDPAGFRNYIQGSGAEFSVAKGIYSQTNSGWFSDRTVRYLASGKPALVQDTGFSRTYPVGEGLLTFQTMEEAVAGAISIETDYDAHCLAARRLAEYWFDSERVLGKLVEQVGIFP